MKVGILVVSSLLVLTGCASTTDPNSGVKSGAVIGAIAGAVIGKQVGGDKGTAIGAVIGGGSGALIGKDRDAQQRRLEESLAAEQAANQVEIQRIDEETIRLNLDSSVTFAVDSDRITPAFERSLDKIVASLQEFPDTRADIVGHTDNTGTISYNQALSERRAEAVGYYFSRQGIPFSRLSTRGLGESQPVASNSTAFGRAQNRRVEIYLRTN